MVRYLGRQDIRIIQFQFSFSVQTEKVEFATRIEVQ